MRKSLTRSRVWVCGWIVALVIAATASAASAETLLMPPRSYLSNTSEVVWGITTQANGTPYVLDYGDGNAQQTGNVADRSYIAFNHTYALANTYTVSLCVGAGAAIPGCPGELATVQVQVFNGATLTPENLRNLNINRAIQDGLRYLWTAQSNRTNFDTTIETSWGNFINPFTALTVLAFENQGYKLPNDNSTPVGIYPKYAVRRGINYFLARLTTLTIAVTPAGNDPCVSVPAPTCSALVAQTTNDPGYENGIIIAALSGSAALNRTNTEVTAANVVNKTLGEILQRTVNATIWGQGDSGTGRGGWDYSFNSGASDGSTVGWDLFGLFDAAAAGANVPAWVKNEWVAAGGALQSLTNNDGSFDYRSGVNDATGAYLPNVAKAGVGVQGQFFAGTAVGAAAVQNALTYISDRWNEQNPVSLGVTQSFQCQINGRYNKGCAYAMFNVFKGLKLYGVTTLPGVTRAAGPGAIPAGDWYADYVDWLLANQTNPTTTAGGNWASATAANNLAFSSQTTNDPVEAAVAELILAPVALIAPDPERFGSVGLQQGNPLSTNPMSNPVNTSHTVTAKAESGGANPAPIPGVTISFQITGRNAGVSGVCAPANCITGANGTVTYTYTDAGPANSPGSDNIQAFIGQVGGQPASNILVKNWTVAVAAKCDANNDGIVTNADLQIINAARGQTASGATDPRDGNSDGLINIADVRYCQQRLTPQ